jgi:hypothetical protein
MIDLELDPALLEALGTAVPTWGESLSPWHENGSVSNEQRVHLMNLGILSAEGTIDASWEPTMLSLARTSGTTQLLVSSARSSLHHVSFGGGRPGPPIGLTAMSDGTVRIQDPGPTSHLLEVVARFIGRSAQQSIVWSLNLDVMDALTFGAILDAQRRRISESTSDSPASPITLEEVRIGLHRPADEVLWIANIVARVSGIDAKSADATTPASIERLQTLGLLVMGAEGAILRDPGMSLAAQFRVPDALLEVDNHHRAGGSAGPVQRTKLFCVRSGADELFTVERVEDRVHFETLSAHTVLGYMERLLESPDPSASGRFTPTHVVLPGGLAPTWTEPHTDSFQLKGVPSGTKVQLVGETSGWAEVASDAGWRGWLDRRWLGDLDVPT